MKRKEFIKLASTGALGISSLGYLSCESQKEIFFKLSLAQWSLHKAIRGGEMSPYLFAEKSKDLGFTGLEYVNQLYDDVMKSEDKSSSIKNFILKNNQLASDNGMDNVLIMIDEEGDLAGEDEEKRLKSIDNHKLWIDTAAEMNCTSVRLNLYGSKDIETWKALSIDSLSKLGEHAKGTGLNVIVENHGRITSNIPELMNAINGVNMDNVGTLPDFGNFCMADEGYGSVFDGTCETVYDFYKGVEEMMPKAFAVSAKSNDFDGNGDEKTIDYMKMLKIVKSFGYTGYIGVEYEGKRLSEVEGIKATRDLLIKVGQSI
ncbi:MAG: xylose isomerase [Cryomorphaceae bacterium MED-G11]|nr:MAG: xylose isomerase [Cryomorphaceae bacterium MED-G11]|tara:strand:- start:781 stop:1731 length:951 start_codon:yes stop_codon:yes gene_type:complete